MSAPSHVDTEYDWPNLGFFVIGAMKCGTSSLYEYLREHPAVCMSRVKETDYLISDDRVAKRGDWYRSLFDDPNLLCGEASPNYSKRHLFPGVPRRMARIAPGARLIYVVRDPVERAYSHYLHNYAFGRENRSFSRAIREPGNGYVLTSCYHYQIQAFVECFPLEQCLVVDAGELRAQTAAVMQRVFGFLGVDPAWYSESFRRRHHVSDEKRRRSWLDRRVHSVKARTLLRPCLPARLIEPQAFERRGITPGDRRYLASVLGGDVAAFQRWSGLAFEDWPF